MKQPKKQQEQSHVTIGLDLGDRRHRFCVLDGAGAVVWAPALAMIGFALYMAEGDVLTIRACVTQLPLIALGMATLLVCAVSPRSAVPSRDSRSGLFGERGV